MIRKRRRKKHKSLSKSCGVIQQEFSNDYSRPRLDIFNKHSLLHLVRKELVASDTKSIDLTDIRDVVWVTFVYKVCGIFSGIAHCRYDWNY